MEIGNIVEIVPSSSLTEMKIQGLAGSKGEVVEIVNSTGNRMIGCWVKLHNPFENELEWFVPISSVAPVN